MSNQRWQEDGIYVLAVGAQTPVGRTALKAAAAVRCGISAYQEHPFLTDRHGEPMVVALADWLGEDSPPDRMIRLGTDALLDALGIAKSIPGKGPVPVMFAMSNSSLPSEDSRLHVVRSIQSELFKSGVSIRAEIHTEGNAIGVQGIQQAIQILLAGTEEIVAVLGVDSHLGPEQLESLDLSGRLHSINNSWGFTPGEGAGAVVLTTGRSLNQYGLIALGQIDSATKASEPNVFGSEAVCLGEGLTRAFRSALSEHDKIDHSFCDLNGETYRADEFGLTICRTGECFHNASSFSAPADCWGDVGSASIPLLVALATSEWSRRTSTDTNFLCWASSTLQPLRGAVRLTNSWNHF